MSNATQPSENTALCRSVHTGLAAWLLPVSARSLGAGSGQEPARLKACAHKARAIGALVLAMQPGCENSVQLMMQPALGKGPSLHGTKTHSMTLRELYREALEQGGEAVSRALGNADAELAHNAGNHLALMYKGSLLTMVGDALLSAAKRRDYIRSGVSMMDSALARTGHPPASIWELSYVRAATLAMLPAGLDHDAEAYGALQSLHLSDAFSEQAPFDQVRCLCLLACEAEVFGDTEVARARFIEARSIDEALAIKTYSDWSARGSSVADES